MLSEDRLLAGMGYFGQEFWASRNPMNFGSEHTRVVPLKNLQKRGKLLLLLYFPIFLTYFSNNNKFHNNAPGNSFRC